MTPRMPPALSGKNIVLNGLQSSCVVTNEDANVLLHQRRFDVVDIDPFGSHALFLAVASRSAIKMLCITATEKRVLCAGKTYTQIKQVSPYHERDNIHSHQG